MTANPPFRTIQLQRDTAANWTSANTLLAEGELGLEMDTRKAKIGDGVTNWNLLDYAFESFDGLVHDTGDEIIGGVKTFSSSPIVPTPTTATQAVNKEYADYTPDFYKYSIVRSVGNLIANNSFETDLSGWSGWLSASFTRDTTEYYHGVASAKIVTDGSAYAQGCYSAVTTKVGSTYAYSCYVKGTAGKQITMFIDGGTLPEIYQTLTGGWDRITGSVTATTTNTSIYIQCRTAGVTTYWLDAVQVEEGTTVAGPFTTTQGNLTVALKNYEGNDPTASKPVKIQIGGVIRTITSALSFTRNAGYNILNIGSSELATKEVDLFAYLFYYPTTGAVVIAYARIPNANTISDLSYDALTEKGFDYPYDGNLPPSSTSIVNIGRFNATLSAGAGYTWSIPATSVIINSPCYETRWLDWQPSVTASGSMTIASLWLAEAKYKISGDSLSINYSATYTTGGTASSDVISTVPFTFLSYSLGFSSPCYDSADFQASGIYQGNGIIIRKNGAAWTLGPGRVFGIHTFGRI